MGLFNKIFSGSNEPEEDNSVPWIALTEMKQLESIAEASKTKTQLIFKHSTRCGISRMVIAQFKKDYGFTEIEANLYYLDLLGHRDISQEIAKRFHVVHESPQLVVIKNGVVVAHVSHGEINNLELEKLL